MGFEAAYGGPSLIGEDGKDGPKPSFIETNGFDPAHFKTRTKNYTGYPIFITGLA